MHPRTNSPAVLLLAFALSACVESPDAVPELTFAHASPILLAVRVAEIDSRYQTSTAASNIERTVTPTPEQALIKWAQQRLRSDGTQNIARFTILDAPLTSVLVDRNTGLASLFGSEPWQRWTVTVEAQLEILDETGARLDGYAAKVSRVRDLEPGITYEERNRFWNDLLTSTMQEFDRQMESGVRQYAARWMR